jgi:hypothetical protein
LDDAAMQGPSGWLVTSLALSTAALLAAAPAAQQAATSWDAAGRRVAGWNDLVDRSVRGIRWLEDGRALWFTIGEGDARRYVRVDCASGERQEAATAAGIGVDAAANRLEPQPARTRSRPRAGERVEVTFVNELDRELVLFWIETDGGAREYARLAPGARSAQSTFDGHAWRLETTDGDAVAAFRAGPDPALAVVDRAARAALVPPRGRGRGRGDRGAGGERAAPAVFVRDGGLWRRDGEGEAALAASGADGFRGDVHLSPDAARCSASTPPRSRSGR